jgi:hypothetical protein
VRPGAPHHLDLNVSHRMRVGVNHLAFFVEDPDRVKLEFVARGSKP